MIKANVLEAKTHLSRYLDAVEKGEVVVLCRHNKPIAEIRRIAAEPAAHAKVPEFGHWDGFGVSESFFEPLDEETLAAFNGQ
jgi:antitoxin (DNA-binding transcriptional repressor) of toxin-antitoxin stability system